MTIIASQISQLVLNQRNFYRTGESRNLQFRIAMLSRLKDALLKNDQLILSALEEDLRKPPLESYSSELGFVLAEINIALKNLKHWAKDKKVGGNLIIFPSKSYIISEPY
jgi:aldehyde dehydrogenase (NAD+)